MTLRSEEADLIAARRLRDIARAIVHTDLATLRRDVAERPVAGRVRAQIISTALDTAESGIDLALENRGVLALTGTAMVGWLFRNPLGVLAQHGWTRARQWLAQLRR